MDCFEDSEKNWGILAIYSRLKGPRISKMHGWDGQVQHKLREICMPLEWKWMWSSWAAAALDADVCAPELCSQTHSYYVQALATFLTHDSVGWEKDRERGDTKVLLCQWWCVSMFYFSVHAYSILFCFFHTVCFLKLTIMSGNKK